MKSTPNNQSLIKTLKGLGFIWKPSPRDEVGERKLLIKALKLAAGALDDDTIALAEVQRVLLLVGATQGE